jgi:hypothetical protein
MQPQKNLNFIFRIFFYSFYVFLRVLLSRRAGNYIHASLQEVKRVNQEERAERRAAKEARKAAKRLEKERKRAAKRGEPLPEVPETEALPLSSEPEASPSSSVSEEIEAQAGEVAPAPVEQAPTPLKEPEPERVDGVYLLALLQKRGRFVDFLQQDITSFSNAEVGEAARVVHDGCSQTLREYFTLEPIRPEEEGEQVTIEAEYSLAEISLVGNVSRQPPYRGELLHHGWKITDQHPPKRLDPASAHVVQPAEIELRS